MSLHNGLHHVNCGVYTVATAFHLQSGVNISAKGICEDEMRPHLLKCLKSGHSNEFSSSKPDKKAIHCQEEQSNLMYFAITDFLCTVSPLKQKFKHYAVLLMPKLVSLEV